MCMGKRATEQEIIEKLAKVLDISIEEATELHQFDKQVDKETMKEVKQAEKELPVNKAKEEKKVETKKLAKGEYTENQKKVMEILKAEPTHFFTAKEISEVSGGALNSRGLGAVVKKLVEKQIILKIVGSPVRYQWNTEKA